MSRKGIPRTEAQKAANAAWHAVKKASPETRAKISAAKMGHEVSETTRAAVSRAQMARWAAWRELKAITAWKHKPTE